jgi:hypothetical protein
MISRIVFHFFLLRICSFKKVEAEEEEEVHSEQEEESSSSTSLQESFVTRSSIYLRYFEVKNKKLQQEDV